MYRHVLPNFTHHVTATRRAYAVLHSFVQFFVRRFVYSYFEKGCRKKCARDNSERLHGMSSIHCSWHSSRRTYFCCFPLALVNMRPWPLVPLILSNFFEQQWTQNHSQYLSELSRALSRNSCILICPIFLSELFPIYFSDVLFEFLCDSSDIFLRFFCPAFCSVHLFDFLSEFLSSFCPTFLFDFLSKIFVRFFVRYICPIFCAMYLSDFVSDIFVRFMFDVLPSICTYYHVLPRCFFMFYGCTT